ncbi:DUF4174 domain-containing protein [Pseudorhodobacter turbinis]|uniref:DUF4174 domain-containing protein n=1 Tax=Pseudorhodobacter turbinis TaxID=2500533 RepID=A0A4P8ECG2_9RHOB|nr:DUF4174 domain-containing protein [Pseudorhodobacter turbinis]QCO54462.1 DUF4174 domain-containing protein [Pseudorhodobacter turbinis]
MKRLQILVLTAFLPFMAIAQPAEPLEIFDAEGVTMDDFLWLKRPVVVFANSPNDPSVTTQLEYLAERPAQLAERDVVVIVDTDPAAASFFRQKLRPRGFSLVIMDKDGSVEVRKPRPWDVREITRAIDKFPLARQEQLERFPSGR